MLFGLKITPLLVFPTALALGAPGLFLPRRRLEAGR